MHLRPILRAWSVAPLVRDQVVVAVLYFGAAQLAFSVAVIHGFACPVWPPAAIGFIAVLWRGRRLLPGLALGVLAANATRPVPAIAIAIALVGNVIEPFVAVWLLRRLRGSAELVRVRDVGIFVIAVLGGAVVSAAGGLSGLLASGLLETDEVPITAAIWVLGNITGAICAAPLVLVPRRPRHAGRIETLVAAMAAVGVGPLAVGVASTGEQYMIFPVLIWAGLRLGPRGAAATTLLLSGLTVAFAARGEGPFVRPDAADTLLTAQGFILVTALTTLLLAAITEDRRRAGTDLAASEDAKRDLAEEQAALRRVATAVAAGPTRRRSSRWSRPRSPISPARSRATWFGISTSTTSRSSVTGACSRSRRCSAYASKRPGAAPSSGRGEPVCPRGSTSAARRPGRWGPSCSASRHRSWSTADHGARSSSRRALGRICAPISSHASGASPSWSRWRS